MNLTLSKMPPASDCNSKAVYVDSVYAYVVNYGEGNTISK